MSEEKKTNPRLVQGTVISASRDKTIGVKVDRKVRHPKYKKYVSRSTKLHAHDENNESKNGDTVLIQECRPLSKTKTWKLVQVLNRAE